MELKISSQFASDYKEVGDISLHNKVRTVLEMLKQAKGINDISQFKKIEGSSTAYKMGIGFYYLVGTVIANDQIVLIRFLRKNTLVEILDQK
ncbi:hypothetical protein [Aquimarina sp. AU474]|uniref:hypothetical protein n=1 Tax=Aquimarina sp. AU474 TaxID=2108529 RepID=UPI000D69E29B|nr:hypothetical protein [Aquimarina sp. AU474]